MGHAGRAGMGSASWRRSEAVGVIAGDPLGGEAAAGLLGLCEAGGLR